ncbi:MAG: hypothetical protein JWQ28_3089 [Pedobacter sp.]|jgi:hypothetical protein|nr:hypothetical protein [Pedobacter sp.]
MLLSAHKDLKAAISALPVKEKDKLLLRLIAKDKILTEHLHFKLLEDESDLEARRLTLLEEIDAAIHNLNANKKSNTKDTLAVMRVLNGKINQHFKVTKDMTSELELRLHLLNNLPVNIKDAVYSPLQAYNEKLTAYFVRATLSAYKKYLKMHEDLRFDFSDAFTEVLNKIHQGKMAYAGKLLNLPEEL